jgi:chromosomal replication initiation ATPase DnaA
VINKVSIEVLQTNIRVELLLESEAKILELSRNSQTIKKDGSMQGVNEDLTLGSLVIGDFNMSARNALSAVLASPGKR